MKSCCQKSHTLAFFLVVCSWLGLTQLVVHSSSVNGADSVYYSTDDFEITEFDRRMYLRNAPDATDEHVGSRIRNLQALSDLYAMEVLMSDADDLGLLSERERDWIARHAVQLEASNCTACLAIQSRSLSDNKPKSSASDMSTSIA